MSEFFETIWNFLINAKPGESMAEADWPPQFAQGNSIKLGLGLVLAFMIWLTVRNYRREGDTSSRAKGALAAIRIAMLVILFLIAMKPALVWHKTQTLYTDLVLLIDDSASMDYRQDVYDTTALERLSDLVGEPADEVEKMSRTEIVQAALNRPDSVLAKLAKKHNVWVLAFSPGQKGSDAYVETLGQLSPPPESDAEEAQAEQAEDDEKKDAPKDLPEQIAEILAQLDGAGQETNYPMALAGALKKVRGRSCRGIVVIGDGQNTRELKSPTLDDLKKQAADARAPIVTVQVGSSSRPTSAAVTSLRTNPRILRGNEVNFAATIGYTNIEQDTVVDVQLQRRPAGRIGPNTWEPVGLANRSITLRRPGLRERNETKFVDVAIPYKPVETGQYEFRAVLVPQIDGKGRTQPDAIARVTIVDERIRILLVSGDSGWEMQRLKDFFLRQPHLYYISVWQQNADKDLNQAASTGMKLDRLPRTLEQLIGSPGWKPVSQRKKPGAAETNGQGGPEDTEAGQEVQVVDGKKLYPGYNVVILYDPEPREGGFDGEFVELLEKFVDPHGGGLIYIASNKNTEEILKNTQFLPLLDLLPVELVHDISAEVELISERRPKPWPLRPTVYGADHPILMVGHDPADSMQTWNDLPGVYWSHSVARTKLGARVLAEHGDPTRTTEDGKREPVIAFQRFGSGRVLYMGTDETWRWKVMEGGTIHRTFWSNAVRYLSTLKPRLVDIYLAEGKDSYNIGTEIKIKARAFTEKYQPVTSETFTVYLIKQSEPGKQREIQLQAEKLAGEAGRFAGTVVIEEPGNYEITALAPSQRADRVSAKQLEITAPEDEKKRPEADPDQLHQAATGASQSGLGRESQSDNFLNIWEIGDLEDEFEEHMEPLRTEFRKELWDTPLALLLVVILLATEWILRKKYNMA